MADINFPGTPANNDIYTFGSRSWRWNGSSWVTIGTGDRFTLVIAASDESTAITANTDKIIFYMPRDGTLTDVRATLNTPQTSGSIFTVDINKNSSSILSTKLTIDNTDPTSANATTSYVFSNTTITNNDKFSVDVDQVGDGTAKGLKLIFYGVWAA